MRVLINESHLETLVIIESFQLDEAVNRRDLINKIKKYASAGLISLALLGYISNKYTLSNNEIDDIKTMIEQQEQQSDWNLVADDVVGTVYNAVPEQCNKDVQHTATMFKLNLKNPASHRIIAIERTMLDRLGLRMGDVVRVEGAGDMDGIWQIQDKMNKRFAGQNKIDFLVNNDRKYGKWDDIKLYKLNDGVDDSQYRSQFAPQYKKA